jgi:threonine/homoserine/homoserine lactone efflux protein
MTSMTGILLMTALAGLGLEIHPGDAVHRMAVEARRGGASAGLRTRLGGLLAVGGIFAVLMLVLLLLPDEAPDATPVRVAAYLLAAAALLCAGWHRIATTSRLDLRRARLLPGPGAGDGEAGGPGVLAAALDDLRRPAWHLFWWAVVPGAVLAARDVSAVGGALVWAVHALVVLGWTVFLALRLRRNSEKVVETDGFRILHSLGGLALVATGGLLLVRALAWAGVEGFVTESVLGPLLG